MGSTGDKLKIFDAADKEKSALAMKEQRVFDLRNWPPSIAGIPIVPASILPTPELASMLADSIEKSDPEAIDYMWHDVATTLDTSMPEGTPFFPIVFDPTFVLPIDLFLEFMLELGISFDLLLANLEAICGLIVKLGGCDVEGFVDGMKEIKPNLDVEKATEKAEAFCPFELPSLDIQFPPSFSLPNFALNIVPIELVMPEINVEFPQLHISILWILQEIINAILKLLQMAIDLALKIIEGIIAFIVFVIEFILNIIIEIIMTILAELMKFIGFVAGIISLITRALRFVVVLIIGHMIGAGAIALAAHAAIQE